LVGGGVGAGAARVVGQVVVRGGRGVGVVHEPIGRVRREGGGEGHAVPVVGGEGGAGAGGDEGAGLAAAVGVEGDLVLVVGGGGVDGADVGRDRRDLSALGTGGDLRALHVVGVARVLVTAAVGVAEGDDGGAGQGLRHQAARRVVAHRFLHAAAAGQGHGHGQVVEVVAHPPGVGAGAGKALGESDGAAFGVEGGGDGGGPIHDGVAALAAGGVVAVAGGQAVVGAAGQAVGGVKGGAVGLGLDGTGLGLRLAGPGDGVAVGVVVYDDGRCSRLRVVVGLLGHVVVLPNGLRRVKGRCRLVKGRKDRLFELLIILRMPLLASVVSSRGSSPYPSVKCSPWNEG